MEDERKKLRDEAERAFDTVVEAWDRNGPPPRTAILAWMEATNTRLRRIETGSFTDNETPTRRVSQQFQAVRVDAAIREGRRAAGLDPEYEKP